MDREKVMAKIEELKPNTSRDYSDFLIPDQLTDKNLEEKPLVEQ